MKSEITKFEELTLFEKNIIDAIFENCDSVNDFSREHFILKLRKIMPSTCSTCERIFLDEIKEKGKLFVAYGKDAINLPHSVFHQDDFSVPISAILK